MNAYNVEIPVRGQLEKEKDYNDRVKANENYINQNFKELAAKVDQLEARLKTLGG